MDTEFESCIFKCTLFMSIKASYRVDTPGSGFGGITSDFLDSEDTSETFPEMYHEHEKTFDHLNDLVRELAEKLNGGTSSKTHKILTPAPEKPGKRECVFKHGEKTLKPIPLQTKAFPDFVNDPLVPHAYLVKTA